MPSSYDSLSTGALRTIGYACGVRGRALVAAMHAQARAAAHAAELRAAVEAALVAEWPLLAQMRERVRAGGYADDTDEFTPLERDRLRFTVWLVAHGRIGDG